MPSKVPPSGNQPPATPPSNPSNDQPAPPATTGGQGQSMTEFMKQFTPEERKKLDQIMNQNFANELAREDKYREEQLKYRKEIDPESYA